METVYLWLVSHLGGLVAAILLLILAFIVSAIVRNLVVKLLNKTRLAKAEATARASDSGEASPAQKEGLVTYIGKLAYLIVFLLFIPGICSALGVNAISEPISGLLYTVWGFVPNIIAAAVILVAGTLIAKLVRELLIPLFKKLHVDELQEKAGVEVKDDARLSTTLAYIVYVLIIIPVIIAALEALRISVISTPAVAMLEEVLAYIPNIAVAIVLILVGTRIAKFTGNIVKRLIAASGFDKTVRDTIGETAPKFVFSDTVAMVVRVVLDIFFIVQGISVLNLAVLNNIGTAVIGYMPSVLAAVLILIAAFLAAGAADKALGKNGLAQYGVIARVAIITVAVFMVLSQLGIAGTIVNAAFILLVAALAVAFAIAFGVGGRDFAKERLAKLSALLDSKKE